MKTSSVFNFSRCRQSGRRASEATEGDRQGNQGHYAEGERPPEGEEIQEDAQEGQREEARQQEEELGQKVNAPPEELRLRLHPREASSLRN